MFDTITTKQKTSFRTSHHQNPKDRNKRKRKKIVKCEDDPCAAQEEG